MELVKREKCSGCMACRNACPKNVINIRNIDGFEYPEIDKENCINCGLCRKVCPIISEEARKESKKIVYACKANDEKIRMNSSSGGIFTLVAEKILEEKGVVFAARFNEEFEVIHDYTESVSELDYYRGSKYLQSKIGMSYKNVKKFLIEKRKVLFVGTPCQVDGLLSYLGKKYENLYTIDLICHGVPSEKVWKKYLLYKQKKHNSKIQNVNFRRKEEAGWSNFQMYLKSALKEEMENHNKDPYMKLFLENYDLRESCYQCNSKNENRKSDLTIADYWGINDIRKEFNDEKGVSAVIVNTEKGELLFEKIKPEMEFVREEMESILKYNYMLIKSVELNDKRKEFFKDLENLTFEEIVEKYIKNN